jgi:hypothetical protein
MLGAEVGGLQDLTMHTPQGFLIVVQTHSNMKCVQTEQVQRLHEHVTLASDEQTVDLVHIPCVCVHVRAGGHELTCIYSIFKSTKTVRCKNRRVHGACML